MEERDELGLPLGEVSDLLPKTDFR